MTNRVLGILRLLLFAFHTYANTVFLIIIFLIPLTP